jgi:hypothetical protein
MLPLGISRATDDLMKADLRYWRDLWFGCLLFSTATVGVGLALEGPELWFEIRDMFRRRRDRHRFFVTWPTDPPDWMKLMAFAGWILIVLGVMGEGAIEAVVSDADSNLQSFTSIQVAEAQREAAFAIERSGGAYERAAQAEEETQRLKAENLKLEALIQPRTISVETQRQIADACGEFTNHAAVIESYGLDTEAFATGSQIIAILHAMKVVVADARASKIATGTMETGIHIRTTDASEMPLASCFAGALDRIEGNWHATRRETGCSKLQRASPR